MEGGNYSCIFAFSRRVSEPNPRKKPRMSV